MRIVFKPEPSGHITAEMIHKEFFFQIERDTEVLEGTAKSRRRKTSPRRDIHLMYPQSG
jgi:hypothetical protein